MQNDDKKIDEGKDSKETSPPPEHGPLGGKFTFKVNGEQFQSPHQKLVALDILKLAKDKGAIPGNPEEYLLQGDKKQYKPDEWVDLEVDNVFITVPNKSTPVA